jgi:hypothetical protein
MYPKELSFDYGEKTTTYGFLAAELLSALHTLVLPCSSWTCEEIPLGSATMCSTDSSFAAPYYVDQFCLVVLWPFGDRVEVFAVSVTSP